MSKPKKTYKAGEPEQPKEGEQPEEGEQQQGEQQQGEVTTEGNPADPEVAPEVVSDPASDVQTIQGIPGLNLPGQPAEGTTLSGAPITGVNAAQVAAWSSPVPPPISVDPIQSAPEQLVTAIQSQLSGQPLPDVGHPDLIGTPEEPATDPNTGTQNPADPDSGEVQPPPVENPPVEEPPQPPPEEEQKTS